MIRKMKILHFIPNEKFTAGYVNFMKTQMSEYSHCFVINVRHGDEEKLIDELVDEDDIFLFPSYWRLAFSAKIRKLMVKADKIIISGIFGIEKLVFFWPQYAFDKLYFHYWGGDFYQLRNNILEMGIRKKIYYKLLKRTYEKSVGAIFLIKGEEGKFTDITGIDKEHVHIAAMPFDPLKRFDYSAFRERSAEDQLRIVVGNSATPDNCHAEVFRYLLHLKDENIEIYCPLVYGDEIYRHEIITMGNNLFGEKFHAVTEWMEAKDYYIFLSTCQIGIYNNNRQQGMGNIYAMLNMGRKVYLRVGTTMYQSYMRRGFVIHDVEELSEASIEEISDLSEGEKNIKVFDSWNYDLETSKQWKEVFDDKI